MTPAQTPAQPSWNHYSWWAFIGWLLIAAVVALSVISLVPPIDIESGDKFEHALAYAILMYWWGMLQPHRRWAWALALPLLGVGMEFVQSFMPLRHMDWRDALANTLGVTASLLLLLTPLGRLLRGVDQLLADRFDSGRS